MVLAVGFADGVIRIIVVDVEENVQSHRVTLVQYIKPHKMPITRMSLHPRGHVLVSASEDGTVFVLQLVQKDPHVAMVPIGFVEMPSPVNALCWGPAAATLVVGCSTGHLLAVKVPERPHGYVKVSYRLSKIEMLEITNVFTKVLWLHFRRDDKLWVSTEDEDGRGTICDCQLNLDLNVIRIEPMTHLGEVVAHSILIL